MRHSKNDSIFHSRVLCEHPREPRTLGDKPAQYNTKQSPSFQPSEVRLTAIVVSGRPVKFETPDSVLHPEPVQQRRD